MQGDSIEKMKRSAERQMTEMHRRAAPEKDAAPAPSDGEKTDNAPETPPVKEVPSDLFSSLLKDKDRTIILSLLLLMMEEDGHQDMILALLYMLL